MSLRIPERELRALDVLDVIPAGHFGVFVATDAFEPHLHEGEIAVVDTADKDVQFGELFVVTHESPLRPSGTATHIVQPFNWDDGHPPGSTVSYRYGVPDPSVMRLVDGPLAIEGWQQRCRGRVVGVMVPK